MPNEEKLCAALLTKSPTPATFQRGLAQLSFLKEDRDEEKLLLAFSFPLKEDWIHRETAGSNQPFRERL